MRWNLCLIGSCLAGAAFLTGCAWNRHDPAPADAPAATASAGTPLGSEKYKKLVEQFNGNGDRYEQKVRGLDEESWTDALKSAGSKVKNALTLKPKVTPAADPISLASGIPPLGPDVFYHAGQLAEERGRPDEALRQYRKSLEKDPKYLPTMIAAARLLDLSGKTDEAMQLYQAAIQAHPKEASPLNDLGLTLSKHRQWPAAEAALRRAVELAPHNARYRNNLARVLVRTGKVDSALKELLVTYEPAVAHYNVAYLLKESGQIAVATTCLKKALELDPTLKPAALLLAKLSRSTPPATAQATPPNRAQFVAGPQQQPRNTQSPGPVRSASLQMPSTFQAASSASVPAAPKPTDRAVLGAGESKRLPSVQ